MPLESSEPVSRIPESPHPAPDVTPTHSQSPEPVASTSSNTDRRIITPEEISPFPKAPPRKNKGGRKKGKTLVLTDTPIKEQIRAAEEEKKRKKDKQGSQKTKVVRKSSKKLKLQYEDVVDGDSTSSNGEADERTFCDDDDDASDYDELEEKPLC